MTDPHKQMGRVIAKARAKNDRINLDALIEAVEAGSFPVDMCAADLKFLGIECIYEVYDVFSGSLDAAKALHDALLPGWRVEVFNLDGEVVLRRNRPIDRAYGDAMNSGEVARAWLLAILKAYRATMEEPQ